MLSPSCAQPMPDGRRCRAPLLRDGRFCFWHEPGKAEEAHDARRLGGVRRGRERTLAVAYDLAGLGSIEAIRRIVEIALFDPGGGPGPGPHGPTGDPVPGRVGAMIARRRLAKLEGALSPKAATLLWLTEAHGFGSLEAYVDWLVDQPADAAPFWRVPEQAEHAVRAAMRGEPRSAVEAAASTR